MVNGNWFLAVPIFFASRIGQNLTRTSHAYSCYNNNMSRKVKRVRFRLDTKDVTHLPHDEVVAILRGADDLIMMGGRNLLTKILKGSRDKKLFSLNLDTSPVYGYHNHLTLAKIQARVDWVILNGYLTIEYELSIPLLRYTPKGWAIEKDTFARELLAEFDQMLKSGQTEFDINYLKDRSRDMIFHLLDLVEATENPKYIPILNSWAKVDYKKVQARIHAVIQTLGGE